MLFPTEIWYMIKSYQYQLEYPRQIQIKLLKKIYNSIFFNYAFREDTKSYNFIKNEIRKRLFNDAFRTATNVNTGNVNFTQFVRQINKFENQNPGKLDILFSDVGGASVAQNFRQTMKQLLEIDPKFKSTEIKRLIRSLPDETGLTATQTGLEFIEGLKTLAREADIN